MPSDSNNFSYGGNLGGFIFHNEFIGSSSNSDTVLKNLYYKAQDSYSSFTEDMQKQIENNITLLRKFFTIKDNTVNLTDTSVLEEYLSTIAVLQNKFKNNQDALQILSKYTDFYNILMVSAHDAAIPLYAIFNVDKDNVCGLADALSCGLPQIYYCMYTLALCIICETTAAPIISTISVSFTFTKVTQ